MSTEAKTKKETPKLSYKDKTESLQQKLESAKRQLVALEKQRKDELGALAFKAGLAGISDAVLAKEFATLSERHS